MEKKDKNLNSINNPDYQKITTKLFYNSLLNIPIFAVPAFTFLFIGKALDQKFATGKTITIVMLFVAFTFSWYMVLRKNTKLNKEYRDIREKMKSESQDNNID